MAYVPGRLLTGLLVPLQLANLFFGHSECQAIICGWRLGSSVAVLKDTLYVIGGWTIAQKESQTDLGSSERRVLSIPLWRSWSVGDAIFQEHANSKFGGAEDVSLWSSPDETKIYTWGGRDIQPTSTSYSRFPRLRTFTPASAHVGNGQGAWEAEVDPPRDLDKMPPQRIYRTASGSWTSCNGFGFYMGGELSKETDLTWPYRTSDDNERLDLEGLVIYDMNSKKWTNQSVVDIGGGAFRASHTGETAVCLPTLGTEGKGVLLFFGCFYGLGQGPAVGTEEVLLYDIGKSKFHIQQTTGDILAPRALHCAVAAKAVNSKGYEIILFGGLKQIPAQTYVLMVPGFHWFREDHKPPSSMQGARSSHACAVVGRGGRQMIAVGGIDIDWPGNFWWRQDPWGNGVQVLDMTNLTWSGEYKHDAPNYEQPKVAKEWYSDVANAKNIQWNTNETRALFADAIDSLAGDPTYPPSGPLVGMIVGTAISVPAALAVIAVCIVYFCYYRPRCQRREQEGGYVLPFELLQPQNPVEVEADHYNTGPNDKTSHNREWEQELEVSQPMLDMLQRASVQPRVWSPSLDFHRGRRVR
ncbi:hypothetical protein MAPG_08730 [Magnaporthiopsis poae ATCC 64411]|uniref:Kelch repeat protein n=1 Tax=Magnaporthiopsis poae (strain ATCC 64411 / 73-15) TaxID=644358 RepID=A0A0C4E842_MAGP6|nr:hypothetical protein MAPG_08730 [Magnaporthiopsis poae ATCC 64411]